jgi:D-alanyl-D-alanine carboxypeptidase
VSHRAWLAAGLIAAFAGTACAGRGAGPAEAPSVMGPLAGSIDATLAAAYGPDGPGVAAIVVKDGQVVLRKGYGLANVELHVAMRPDAVMPIASLTKAFTAAAILQLAERGKLSLDDDVTSYLPGYPTRGAKITVEHLLTHTSGISALAETADLRAFAEPEGRVVDLIGDWVRDLPPDFAPGEKWAYLNWGYSLLGAIVERASGQTYAAFLQQSIFDPIGMTHTYYGDRRRMVPLRATGYDAPGDTAFNGLPPRGRVYHPAAAGGLLSSVDDLARWSAALDGGRVLRPSSVARMFTPYRLADGTSTRYGYGWDIGEYAGHLVQEHAGGTTGYASYVVRMPDDRVFVALLSNRNPAPVPLQTTAHRVAAIAVGRPVSQPTPVPVSTAVLGPLAGVYRGSDVGTCTVTLEGGALGVQIGGLGKLRLTPVGPMTFRAERVLWSFTFETGQGGRGTRLRVRDWKIDDVAERVEPIAEARRPLIRLEAAEIDACVGEYESLNGVLVMIERAGDHLSVRPAGERAVEVFPVSRTEFVTAGGEVSYRFVVGVAGKVEGYLRAGAGRPVPARRTGPR